jgi:hypothetical protein
VGASSPAVARGGGSGDITERRNEQLGDSGGRGGAATSRRRVSHFAAGGWCVWVFVGWAGTSTIARQPLGSGLWALRTPDTTTCHDDPRAPMAPKTQRLRLAYGTLAPWAHGAPRPSAALGELIFFAQTRAVWHSLSLRKQNAIFAFE